MVVDSISNHRHKLRLKTPEQMNSIRAYNYTLPQELIAAAPPEERTGARLMLLNREKQTIEHRQITDLPDYLSPGDCLVFNNTKVIPAKLQGFRTSTEGKWEGLFLGRNEDGAWRVIGQTRGKIKPGETISLTPPVIDPENPVTPLELELIERVPDEGSWLMKPRSEVHFLELLEQYGSVPLPPYIKREQEQPVDKERYQTTYAEHPGSVAAPTAGLHFTPELIERCREKNISTAFVTLHVGLGTFRPIKVDKLDEHDMHSEWCEVSPETVETIEQAKQAGGKVVAIGTTTVRTLESASQTGQLTAWSGETNLYIKPPYEFKTVDKLLTNFHLPKSTLLVLVSTFSDREFIREAYQTAIDKKYRFFSYGDAMLIV